MNDRLSIALDASTEIGDVKITICGTDELLATKIMDIAIDAGFTLGGLFRVHDCADEFKKKKEKK